MNLKERFESHPAPWGLGLIFVGFSAGFAARAYFLPPAVSSTPPVVCNVLGAEALANGHNTRMQQLQASLSRLESQASDQGNIPSYQDVYKASADRVRKDISQETESFRASVAALSNKCTG